MYKLLLINPVGKRSGYLMSQFSTFSPLGLAYVAALTPSDWEVEIIDENYDEFVIKEADLIGITAFTSNINRAYELAQIYRNKKIPVILGGIHVSMYAEEALQFADSVVIGEAEGVWNDVIQDFEKNQLQRKYFGPRVDLEKLSVTPRRDLLHPNYLWHSIQTSRGCPFDCKFCTVSKYLGRQYRQRTADDVLCELEDIPGDFVAFVDDNLIGYSAASKARAKALFTGMLSRGIRKKWWMQTSINAADDEEIIELAARSGCMFVFVGFESINPQTLKGMNKKANISLGIENYKRVVDTFHRYGIAVLGAFIIGNDDEPSNYYQKLSDFIITSGVDMVQVSILTPLPGTQLMEELKDQNRILFDKFPGDWEKYRFSYVVHQPSGTDKDAIYAGDNYIKNRIYSFPVYQRRLISSFLALKFKSSFYATVKLNKALKKSWKNAHYYKERHI